MFNKQVYSRAVKMDQTANNQVNHLTKSRNPIQVYGKIDNNFVQSIQSRTDPSLDYIAKMKALQLDQLDMGLQQYNQSRMLSQTQKQQTQKDYRQRVNGVLGQIQKNIMQRSELFQNQLNKQQMKKKLFVDDNLLKQRKILQHVNLNYDKDVFNHESDKYQSYQQYEHMKTLQFQQLQQEQKNVQNKNQKIDKQLEREKRLQHQTYMAYVKIMDEQRRKQNQQRYKLDLKTLMQEKQERNRKISEPVSTLNRHNPITNPIEYHIQNPYILKRLQQKFR